MIRRVVLLSLLAASVLALVRPGLAERARRRDDAVGVDPFYEDEDPDDEITPEQAQQMWDRIVERLEWEQR